MENYDELWHFNIKGAKWGLRRFQNKDGTLTPAGKLRYRKNVSSNSRIKTKMAGSPKKPDERNETIAQKKKRLLASKDAKEIYKNRDLFTDKELKQVTTRYQIEADLKKYVPVEKSKAQAFMENFAKKADTLADAMNKGTKAYNAGAKIFNTFLLSEGSKPLPMIKEPAKPDKNDDKNDDKKDDKKDNKK